MYFYLRFWYNWGTVTNDFSEIQMTGCQPTLLDAELTYRASLTRRGAFLEELEQSVPWDRFERLVGPHYFEEGCGRPGRPAVPLSAMLRMYLVSVVYNLSDRQCQDECNDSAAVRAFVGLGERDSPDETTLCKFRHLLEDLGLGGRMLEEVNDALAKRGLGVSTGTIVDATFVESASSTKNASRSRDPEAHQGKKGNNWHFGYKAHIGVDASAGTVHTLEVTAANVADIAQAHLLVRKTDEDIWADSGYTGVAARPEVAALEAPLNRQWHVAAKRSKVTEEQKPHERELASVRSRVEHPFHVLKDIFKIRKVRYRGKAKVGNLLSVAFALANLLLAKRAPRVCPRPAPAPGIA